MAKTNKARKFHGGGRRPDNTKFKQEEAIERQAAYDALTTAQKVARLDQKLGIGIGAKKQRAKLAKASGNVAMAVEESKQ
jgi:hypothetical protein